MFVTFCNIITQWGCTWCVRRISEGIYWNIYAKGISHIFIRKNTTVQSYKEIQRWECCFHGGDTESHLTCGEKKTLSWFRGVKTFEGKVIFVAGCASTFKWGWEKSLTNIYVVWFLHIFTDAQGSSVNSSAKYWIGTSQPHLMLPWWAWIMCV